MKKKNDFNYFNNPHQIHQTITTTDTNQPVELKYTFSICELAEKQK